MFRLAHGARPRSRTGPVQAITVQNSSYSERGQLGPLVRRRRREPFHREQGMSRALVGHDQTTRTRLAPSALSRSPPAQGGSPLTAFSSTQATASAEAITQSLPTHLTSGSHQQLRTSSSPISHLSSHRASGVASRSIVSQAFSPLRPRAA